MGYTGRGGLNKVIRILQIKDLAKHLVADTCSQSDCCRFRRRFKLHLTKKLCLKGRLLFIHRTVQGTLQGTYRIDTSLYNTWLWFHTREVGFNYFCHSFNINIIFFCWSIPAVRIRYLSTMMRTNLQEKFKKTNMINNLPSSCHQIMSVVLLAAVGDVFGAYVRNTRYTSSHATAGLS